MEPVRFLISVIWTIAGIVLYFKSKNKDMGAIKMLMCFILASL
jgi:Ni,Fe-hydrogenase I cytochrome b subunit